METIGRYWKSPVVIMDVPFWAVRDPETPIYLIKPRGSEYPNSRVSGPKIHTLNGFWTLKPYYLGTWTLREGI